MSVISQASKSMTFLIGLVIGGVVVVLAIVGLVTFCIVRRKNRQLVSENGEKETHLASVQVVGGEYSIIQIGTCTCCMPIY
jgi:hypothetical protein